MLNQQFVHLPWVHKRVNVKQKTSCYNVKFQIPAMLILWKTEIYSIGIRQKWETKSTVNKNNNRFYSGITVLLMILYINLKNVKVTNTLSWEFIIF